MSVITIIISILLPVLGAAKRYVKESLRVSFHRQFIAAFYSYTYDYDGLFPYLSDRDDPENPRFIINGWEYVWGQSHFGKTMGFWPSVIVTRYMDVSPNGSNQSLPVVRIENEPGEFPSIRYVGTAAHRQPSPFLWSPFFLTEAATADPKYFTPGGKAPPDPGSLFAPQRIADVRYPSNKGLLIDLGSHVATGPDAGKKSVGMVDGSAGYKPFTLSDGNRPAVIWTRHGVYGRDF